jgi:hypothetical protein
MTAPRPYLALAVTALFIAGCSDSLTTANAGPGGEITHDVGITARDEVEAALGVGSHRRTVGGSKPPTVLWSNGPAARMAPT